MDVIESIKKDKAYVKCKLIVKNWEKEFKVKHSRIPSKYDIKEAPAKIKYAYKKYFQLKSAALEDSLSLCEFDEGWNSPEALPRLERVVGVISPGPNSELLLPKLPSGQQLEKLFCNIHTQKKQNESCDVDLPTKQLLKTEKNKEKDKPLSPFTDNLSKKLFHSRKFSLRNPRKSLSKSMSQDNSSQSILQQEDGINTTMSQPADSSNANNDNVFQFYCEPIDNISFGDLNVKDLKESNKSSLFVPKEQLLSTSPKVRKLNEAWLQRATGLEINNTDQNKQINTFGIEISEKFGIANITLNEKCTDYIENSESEEDELNKIKPALKKRKLDSIEILTKNLDKSIQNEESPKKSKSKKNMGKSKMKDNSASRRKPLRPTKSKTELMEVTSDVQEPPDISEYLPFGIEENIAPRHLNIDNTLKAVSSSQSNDSDNKKKDSDHYSKLENKIKLGTLNDNFVKINIEKKVFVRGKKNMNYSRYKKKLNKDKKALHAGMEFPESGKITCFKCGQGGHMARYCTAHRGDSLLPLESYKESDLPTLADMQSIVDEETNNSSLPEQLNLSVFETSKIPESFIKMLNETPSSTDVQPIYSDPSENPEELYDALKLFGHEDFRPGQKDAIMRILCGMSTLLILATGTGKSLCYQLPAYIYCKHYKCITLVISPLVSLMEDQVLSMPEFLKAGCLHTNQSPTQRQKIIQCLKDGQINILLISPEALISGDTSNGFSGLFKSLPPISFVCIDEAHCVSQWSHNFRPSYLMICKVLREKLNVKCILGLTATASQSTIKSVISHINIPDGITGVIRNPALPDNLRLSASLEKDKDRALVSFLTSAKINNFNSIIVYCIRRDECVRVAGILRSCLQETGKVNMENQQRKRKRMSYVSEAYHAGMSAAQRKKIQKHFMDGTLRIIVATVAFGMGINKPDIRCIIHYNMPSSFESYVQEVGRAGRDGKISYCHVFMDKNSNDKSELLKHIHANSIDRPTLRKLLQKVFIPCECKKNDSANSQEVSKCKGHEVGIPIDRSVEELDLPLENISTLLCYLELHHRQYIKVLNNAYTICKISSYGGAQAILEATKACPPLAMAYLLESKKDPDITKQNNLEFNVIEVAANIGWESGMTKYQLKNLEWTTEECRSKRSLLKVEFNTLGFRIKAPGDLTSSQLDRMLDDLHESVLIQEKTMLYQLDESHKAFRTLGNYSIFTDDMTEDTSIEKSNQLKIVIRQYFEKDNLLPENIELEKRPIDEDRVASDARALIATYRDCTFTGRSIAKIFQGISSPNYPAIVWGRCKFWRSHIHEDFYGIIKIATQQIIQMK